MRAEFALGEAGGFSVRLNGRIIYPIQVAEKGAVWMKLRATGRPGHGSMHPGRAESPVNDDRPGRFALA